MSILWDPIYLRYKLMDFHSMMHCRHLTLNYNMNIMLGYKDAKIIIKIIYIILFMINPTEGEMSYTQPKIEETKQYINVGSTNNNDSYKDNYCSLNLGLYTSGLLFTGILLSIFALHKLDFGQTNDNKKC